MIILHRKVVGLSEEALARFVTRARQIAGLRGTVNVLVTSSNAMRALNFRFRGFNKATDVLSFPSESSADRGRKIAGEVAISADIAARNASQLGHPPSVEIKVLALHGILHLAGYDHERDNGEMARKESTLRRTLKLPDALIERSQASGKPATAHPRTSRPGRARRTL